MAGESAPGCAPEEHSRDVGNPGEVSASSSGAAKLNASGTEEGLMYHTSVVVKMGRRAWNMVGGGTAFASS